MKPRLILAAIAGGITGTLTFSMMNAGLVGPPSPGSIIAYLAMAPRGELIPVLGGVITASIVSFGVSALLLKTDKRQEEDRDGLEEATQRVKDMKAAGSLAASGAGAREASAGVAIEDSGGQKSKDEVRKIIFACDAGMGSSAMGASILRKKMKSVGSPIEVSNMAISDIPADADIVVTHKTLTDRARGIAPQAEHISIDNFLKSPEYDVLVERLK